MIAHIACTDVATKKALPARDGITILYGIASPWEYCKSCLDAVTAGTAVIAVSNSNNWPEKITSQKDIGDMPIESSVVVYSTEPAYIVGKTISEGNATKLANDNAKSRAQE